MVPSAVESCSDERGTGILSSPGPACTMGWSCPQLPPPQGDSEMLLEMMPRPRSLAWVEVVGLRC